VRWASDDRAKAVALLSAAAVRERCEIVFAAVARGDSRHFRLELQQLGEAADRVAAITRHRL
jgi:inorganic triphosphatase YgiF